MLLTLSKEVREAFKQMYIQVFHDKEICYKLILHEREQTNISKNCPQQALNPQPPDHH